MPRTKKMVRIIGLTGPIGSGKSTAAKHIELVASKCLIPCQTIAFADALKEEAIELGWSGTKDDKGRKMLQDLGQVRRDEEMEYWVNKWYARYRVYKMRHHGGVVLVDDIRYDNEAKKIVSLGGKIIKTCKRRTGHLGYQDHPSEQGISVDYIATAVPNTGDIDNLKFQIEFVLKRTFFWEF